MIDGVGVLVLVIDGVGVLLEVFVGVAVGVGKGHPPKYVALPSPSAITILSAQKINVWNTSKKKSNVNPSQSVPTKVVWFVVPPNNR